MELPNPDTIDMDKRPQHGGRDRHFCIGTLPYPSVYKPGESLQYVPLRVDLALPPAKVPRARCIST